MGMWFSQTLGGAYDRPNCAGVLSVHLAGKAARIARRGHGLEKHVAALEVCAQHQTMLRALAHQWKQKLMII